MAVTNNFGASTLDLNGKVVINQPTALVWGPDGRLFVTEADGDVRVLSVAFGDKNPLDADNTAQFYVTEAVTLSLIKGAIQNHNDNGTLNAGQNRQVTGIDVTQQFDANGAPVLINGKPAVTIYVTSSDSRIGAGGGGGDINLDTNSGVITKLVQTGPNSWDAIDIVRGLPRSEENHATNGLEVIQVLDANGNLVSERMIVASGGNANTGAPSNNFAGQQEQPLSGALLEVDLTMISGMAVQTDANGRKFVYDLPTLNDPTRAGNPDSNDPFGGNDGFNSAKLLADGPVSIYSPGYRNAYDVEVSEDGRVWTYDNGANNSWGGRPIGEAGDNGNTVDLAQALGYIATNLNNGEGNPSDPINLVNWNPSNKDNFHEATRSDDLEGRALSAGQGGAQTFVHDGLTYVYGGHPNPTRAEGALAGLLFSPGSGANNAYLLVSDQDSYDDDDLDISDYDAVIDWFETVEQNPANAKNGIYGVNPGDLTKKVLAVTPGVLYDIYSFTDGSGAAVVAGASPNQNPPAGGTFLGQSGLPADIAEIVAYRTPIEGDYKEAGKTDGALDTGNGSINGLTEYTSTILDQGNVKMSGAIIAAQLNGGNLIIMGRNEDGTMSSGVSGGFAIAADRTTFQTNAKPLGLASLGDDFIERGLTQPFQGSIWVASYSTTQPFIQILQPNNGAVPLAGQEIVNPTDRDLDGVDNIEDPFEYSATNGFALAPGEQILIDFNPQNVNFPNTISATGLLGAALDGVTPNRDAQTVEENFTGDQILDGLYDIGGNILPGGNAPILQIKKVVAGTVVGTANSARDALHTGIRPSADTDRIVATIEAKNWILEKSGVVAAGQLTGMMFGDGTQSNFVRFVFGSVNGGLGFEVGYEIDDVYTVLEQVLVPALANAGANTVEMRLTLDKKNGFAVTAEYRLEGQSDFTAVNLNGFFLPEDSVLRDVLTGDHTIGTGAAEQTSGAAIGFLAENAPGETLDAVDFYSLKIEAFGNEIEATTAAEVGQPGSPNVDTVKYIGTETALAPLAPDVENFDGTGSAADYAVTGNALDNVIRPGTGANVITTGDGADVVRGTLAQLAGDEITDFSTDDKIVVEGALLNDFDVTYAEGSAILTINGGATITFSGPDFEDFAAADGPSIFNFTQTQDGVEITTAPALTPIIAINAGGPAVANLTVRDQVVNFVANTAGGAGAGYTSTGDYKPYTNAKAASFNFPNTDLDPIHVNERSSAVNNAKWGYAVPVENGVYLVDLIYAEIFHGFVSGTTVDNLRVFDVFLENALVEDDYDIFDDAGGAGIEVIKSYQVTVSDGTLNIEFQNVVDQAKLSGLVVWKVGGTFVPPADTTAPVIESITVENPQLVQDGVRSATVVLKDETDFDIADFSGLTGSELTFTGIVPTSVSAPAVTLSPDAKTATLVYTLTAAGNSWPNGVGQIAIAAGAYGDAAGNASAAAQSAFVLQNNLGSLDRGAVVRAINVGTTDPGPGTLGPDPLEGGLVDNNRYGGAIAADSIITDAFGNPVAFEADNNAWYTSPKTNAQLNANVDGQSGGTGSNSGGVDLDGSAYHTYRDSAAGSWTATYSGFAPGTYIVELHFAELFHGTAGNRQGDFTLNGLPLALNFDPFTAAGGADKPTAPLRKAVTVTDGNIIVGVSADTGQPGFSAIVVYSAADPNLPPTISVGDVQAVEGSDAVVTFTRTGDLDEAITITFVVTPGTATADDYTAPEQTTVVIPANQGSVSITIPIVDDTLEEGAETFTVSILSATYGANNAVIADGVATVTIAASDSSIQAPVGNTIFELDFEGVEGEALEVGGFDGALGTNQAIVVNEATSQITGGKLVVQTAEGDINDTTNSNNASINDFTKTVDLSDPALTEIFLTTRFDNPFDQAFFDANGLTPPLVPNFAQQGIVFGTGTQLTGEMVKLVWGGVAGGAQTGVQMWTKGNAVNQAATLGTMAPGVTTLQVATVELSLRIDKTAGTVAQYVTLFDADGAILGGTRPEPTAGFATTAPVAMPPLVLANLVSTTAPTHVGVHSSDNSNPVGQVGSFEVSWDFLRLSSPQFVETPVGDSDSVRGIVIGDFSDLAAAPTDIGALQLGDNVIVATQQGDSEPGGRDRDYFTFTVAEGQVLSQLVLQGFETDEQGLPQAFIGIQAGPVVTVNPTNFENAGQLLGGLVYNGGNVGSDILEELGDGEEQGYTLIGFKAPLAAGTYTVWLNQGNTASTATLNFIVSESSVPVISLSIANAPPVNEGGDTGNASLLFSLTASEGFTGTVTVTYDTQGQTGLTQAVEFSNGVGVLSVAVPRDAVNDGNDVVSVTLTGATGGSDSFEIGTATATGTVIEDDISAVTLPKGALVFAVNAGGAAVTDTNGVTYAADVVGNWVGASNTYSDPVAQQPANGDYTGDGVGNTDDTVYVSERWGGGGTLPPLTFQRGGLTPGDYVLTLKFANIFNGNVTENPTTNGIGARVFDVTVNGVLVIDDLDLIATVGLDRAYDLDVPVTIGPDGVLTIAATATADNAKFSAIALFQAPLPDGVVGIVDAATVQETGDVGTETLLTFPLTLSGPDATVTIGYTVNNVAQTPVEVTFENGLATLTVAVPNDNLDTGTTTATVVITSVSEGFTIAGAGEASGDVTEDDSVDPADIDGDGILNIDDPFAHDGQNGLGRVLTPGSEFRQDFDTDTTNLFSPEAGFTGIIVNPAFTPAGISGADPYGDRTTEATSFIEAGVLKVTSFEDDLFGTGTAIGSNNIIKDNYQSAVDVSGLEKFSIEAKAGNPFPETGGNTGQQFKSFGITLGAGGVNDYVKFVFGVINAGPRVELAHENSLVGVNESKTLPAAPLNITTLVADVVFRIDIDMSAPTGTSAGKLQGFATLLDANGDEIAVVSTDIRDIAPAGSLAAAIAGNNPLTGGTGGLAYGISITDFSNGPGNRFTGEWDYLTIKALDPNAAPTEGAAIAAQTAPEDAAFSFAVPADAFADDGGVANLVLTATLQGGDPLPTWLNFANGVFSGTPEDADVGTVTVTVTATDAGSLSVSQNFTLEVVNTNDAPKLAGTPTADQTGQVGQAFALTLPAGLFADDDLDSGDALTLSAAGLPDGVTFDPTTGAFSGAPTAAGVFAVTVTATDLLGETASDAFTLTVAPTDPIDPTPITVRLQAESATLSGGYQAGTAATANEGKLILIPNGKTSGAATFDLAAKGVPPGVYNLAIGYFDENDGESRLDISLSGETPFNSFFIFDDDATSGNAAQAASFRVRVFEGVTVGPDSMLTLTGLRNAGEWARIDYVEFTGVAGAPDDNQPPFAPFGIEDQTLLQTETLDLDVAELFADAEEDSLTFTVDGPDWLSISPDGRLTGMPGAGDVTTATGVTVTVFANDGFNAPVPVSFQIVVEKVNTPPTTSGIANQTLRVGQEASVSVVGAFEDADDDPLTYTVTGALPAGLEFDETTGEFTGEPEASGSFQVTVTASDGEAAVASTFVFNILPPTDARPTLRIEAETFDLAPAGFFIESLSGGRQVIRLQPSKSGEATLDFAGTQASGAYDLRIAFYDENDGVSSASLSVDADGTGAFTPLGSFLFDQTGGGNAAQLQNLRILTFPGLVAGENAVLKLNATATAFEFARFDYIELVPVAGAVNFAPFVSNGVDDVTQATPAEITIDLDAVQAFSDPEEDALSYSIVSGPEWLSIVDGVLTGTSPAAGVYQVTVGATDGPAASNVTVQTSFTITVEGDAPVNLPPSVALTQVLDEIAEDEDTTTAVKVADIVVTDDALGTNVLSLSGDDAALFQIVDGALYLKAGTALDFETKAQLDVTVQVDDADVGDSPDATADFTLTVTDVNEAPTAVALSNLMSTLPEGTLAERTKVADIVVTDDALGTNVLSLAGADADLFEVDQTGLYLKAGAVLDFGTSPSLDVTVQVDDATVGATPDATADFTLTVTEVDQPEVDPFAPDGDLDGDGIINSLDDDVDGDGIVNINDSFAYDVENGMTLAAGETRFYGFDVDGTIFQNGMTGFLQGTSTLAGYNKDTGAASVANGLLTINPVTAGDTGSANNPQDDVQVGVKNGSFTATAVVLNPWFGPATNPNSFDQMGLHLGLNSLDMVKLVFGQAAGVVEFQKQDGGVSTKYGGTNPAAGGSANVPFPAGVNFDNFERTVITFVVESISPTSATVAGSVGFLAADGSVISTQSYGTAQIGGALAAALANPNVGVGVGFTQADGGGAPTFIAQMDSLSITAAGGAPVNNAPTGVVLTNVVTEIAESQTNAFKVADITVVDDGVGTNVLGLTGADAGLFEIIGTALFLKAGQTLDAIANPTLDVAVTVDDPDVGGTPDATSTPLAIPVVEVVVPQEQIVLRINAFGPQVAATDGGPVWLADLKDNLATPTNENSIYLDLVSTDPAQDRGDTQGYSGNPALIPAGVPQAVLNTARSSNQPFSYDIPVADIGGAGSFRVNLYFAELFTGNQAVGERVFDIGIEGQTVGVLDNFDPSGAGAGGNLRVVGYEVTVTDGVLNIDFAQELPANGGSDNPIINAIEVVRLAGAPVDTQAPTAVMTLTSPTTVNSPLLVSLALSDASGIDTATLGAQDLQLQIGGAPVAATVTYTGFAAGVATYQIAAPSGGWINGQTLTVTLPAGEIADLAPTPNVNATLSQSLSLAIGGVAPPDPGNAAEAFASQTDLFKGASYAAGVNGAAILKIMEGSTDVASSNFGANSFQVENIGSKKISAIFIDVTSALYPDSVFDPDGLGGDNVAKSWAVNTAGGTGGYVSGGVGGYFLPGQAPIPNSGGSGGPSNGGYKGAMVKFAPNVDGGFEFGEVVGFSGDMDPNSIAGMSKGNVDSGATQNWDVGGISGHEMIGSLFTVLFDDGTTASGQLIGDKSNAGSIAIAQQGLAPKEVSLTVNGTDEGGVGTYGGTPPTVIVEGDPGQLVRITMTRGFDPVTNPLNGIDGLVTQRLSRYDFKANNAYDEQSVDVTLGANGTFDATNLFKYGSASGTGKGSFAADKTSPIGFVAAAIGAISDDVVALGPVTAPIYLNSNGSPVVGGATAPQGFYQAIGSGANVRFKVQAEDQNAGNGGIVPGGNWSYFNAADPVGTLNATTGDQAGFQGTGYLLFGPNQSTSTGITNVAEDNVIEYTINITETGTYNFRLRASRDGLAPSDAQNDIWLNFKKQGTNENIDDYLAPSTSEPEPVNQNYIKVFGGPNNGTWGFATAYDGAPNNPPTQLVINETGLYTVQIAGRSLGFHMDFWELYKGSAPAVGATNSAFVPTGPSKPTVANPIADQEIEEGEAFSLTIPAGTFQDLDGDVLTLSINAPTGFVVTGATITAPSGLAIGDYTITVTATDDDDNQVSDEFIVSVIGELPISGELRKAIVAGSDDTDQNANAGTVNLIKGDLELGDKGRDIGLRFTDLDLASLAGVDITDAYIEFTARSGNSGAINATISIQDSLSAATFTAASGPTDRDTFAFKTNWTDSTVPATGTKFRTSDFSDMIEGFLADKATELGTADDIVFVLEDIGGIRKALSFEGNGPALLVIEYDGLL